MGAKLYITSVTGTAPFTFYMCGLDLNNCTLIGTGSTTSPTLTFLLPSIFVGASQVILKMIDNNGCEVIKTLTCDTTCPFDVIINSTECEFCISITAVADTPTPTPTPTIPLTPSITPTTTPTTTPTQSITPSVTPTITQTPTPSITTSITPTVTVSPSVTPTITPSTSGFNAMLVRECSDPLNLKTIAYGTANVGDFVKLKTTPMGGPIAGCYEVLSNYSGLVTHLVHSSYVDCTCV